MARALSLLTCRSRPAGDMRLASAMRAAATPRPHASGATTVWSISNVLGSTVMKPSICPSASATAIVAAGTTSSRQRWRHQSTRRYALADEVLHDRNRARDRELPIAPELRAINRSHVGVAVDPQHPGNLAGNFLFQFEQRDGEPVQLHQPLRFVERGPPRVEKHFRLEHKTVADDANVGAIAENGAQSSEEVGTVSREFLHPLRERYVQPLAQVGNAALRFLVLFLAGFECRFERPKLAAQRRNLLIEHLDLRQRASAEPSLRVKLTAELGGFALRVAASDSVVETLVAVALALG